MSSPEEAARGGSGAVFERAGTAVRRLIGCQQRLPTGPLSERELLLATTLVEDAIHGRFLKFETDESSIRSYRLYCHWSLRWLQHAAVAVILGVALFERPALFPCQIWVTTCLELLALLYLTFRIVHSVRFLEGASFWKDRKNIVSTAVIGLAFVDVLCFLIWMYAEPASTPIRWSRCFRPLLIVNFPQGRQVRTAFRNIRRSLAEIVYALLLLLFSIMLFSLLALRLFSRRKLTYPDGRPYMATYWDCFWSLYVLVTTANNPDVMMPAYDHSIWFTIFFAAYLILNLYIFMHILLAVIFNTYKSNLKIEVKKLVFQKRRKLAKAFDVLMNGSADAGVGKEEKNNEANDAATSVHDTRARFGSTYDRWRQLLMALDPNIGDERADVMLCVLDSNGDGILGKKEFLMITEVLAVRLIEVKVTKSCLDSFCATFDFSGRNNPLQRMVKHRFFGYLFDVVIVVNCIFIGIAIWKHVEWIFISLFIFEIILKIYSHGPRQFASDYWNIFDVVIISAALIAAIVESVTDLESIREVADLVLVIRCLRVAKLLVGFDRFRIIIMTILHTIPSILTYGGVLFVFFYFFAIIGMEAFSGRVTYFGRYDERVQPPSQWFCGNPLLNGSEFYSLRYCGNNFNDIFRAFAVLGALTVVNQWHVLASGFATVTHEAVKGYFIAFHLVSVVLIVNIFVAFVVEAFVLEYSLSQSKYESAIEAKIKEMGYEFVPSKSVVARARRRAHKKADESEPSGLSTEADNAESKCVGGPLASDAEPPVHGRAAGVPRVVKQEKITRFRLERRVWTKVGVLLQQMFESEIDPEDLGPEDLDAMEDVPTITRVAERHDVARRTSLDLI